MQRANPNPQQPSPGIQQGTGDEETGSIERAAQKEQPTEHHGTRVSPSRSLRTEIAKEMAARLAPKKPRAGV